MSEQQSAQEIIQLLGGPSPSMEEEVLAVTGVLHSWGYEVIVAGPLSERYRQRLGALGIRSLEIPPPTGRSLAAVRAHAWSVARQIRGLKPMLVHAHGVSAALAGLLVARGQSQPPPVVASPHFLPHLLTDDPRAGLRRFISRRTLRRCAALVIGSEAQRTDLAQLDREVAERAVLVPSAVPQHVPPDPLDQGRRRQLLGMTQAAAVVGCVIDGLEPAGLALFLDAARELCRDYPSLEFALIGTDVDRPRYHDLAHARGLLGATVFVDPHDQFLRALSALNVLVIPQHGWPAAMLALLALSQDVGVVAVPGGEVAELLPESPGVTITSDREPGALSRAIIDQLRAVADRMPPAEETEQSPEVSPFLVSRHFYDLSDTWETARRASEPPSTPAHHIVATFDPTRAARALAGVYQRVLDGS